MLIHMGCSGLKASRTQAHGMMDKMFEATDSLDRLKRNTCGGNNRRAARLAREFVNNAWRLAGVDETESEEDL